MSEAWISWTGLFEPAPPLVADGAILAVANEGEGKHYDDRGLVDPEGSVTLITQGACSGCPPVVTTVGFGGIATSDEALLVIALFAQSCGRNQQDVEI